MLREALEQSGVAGLVGWNKSDDEDDILHRAWEAAIYPFQLAISPTAIKTYLTVFLFLSTSFILLSISTSAFGLFYYNFIPQTDFEQPIYLQYGADRYPSAEVALDTSVFISQQPYDVSIVLHMPRDPVNLAAGNFMLDLTLHGSVDGLTASVLETLNMQENVPSSVLHRARRSALMPYASPTTDLVSKLVRLPLHLLSWHDSDSVELTVPMFEEVEFARGADNIPKTAVLEIQTQRPLSSLKEDNCGQPQLHIYNAKLVFQVRFHGLRYLIYNYRLLAFAVFSTLFYTVSISTLALVWAVVATVLRSKDKTALIKIEQEQKIKQEPGIDTSDPPRTTTDYKSDKTLRLEGTDRSENEPMEVYNASSGLAQGAEFTPQTSEPASATSQDRSATVEDAGGAPEEQADDEDEEESEDEFEQLQRLRRKMEQDARQRQLEMQQHDSGLGTSMESENTAAARSGLARRSSSRRGKE
ncbi:hypothetical protein LTS08_000021 [Lithohypha guttulata]|uniref:Seipin n=1 Tax=Lithohypha guttulata TaxID=1690604 RepID=A0AAN7SY26_9EURO|nr:hypothetical protein LTR05_005624 [Lithohypha guttulata]KAK5105907.1 hypothetical protein LTS08_000021 [Lithohypha guttulata]